MLRFHSTSEVIFDRGSLVLFNRPIIMPYRQILILTNIKVSFYKLRFVKVRQIHFLQNNNKNLFNLTQKLNSIDVFVYDITLNQIAQFYFTKRRLWQTQMCLQETAVQYPKDIYQNYPKKLGFQWKMKAILKKLKNSRGELFLRHQVAKNKANSLVHNNVIFIQ